MSILLHVCVCNSYINNHYPLSIVLMLYLAEQLGPLDLKLSLVCHSDRLGAGERVLNHKQVAQLAVAVLHLHTRGHQRSL